MPRKPSHQYGTDPMSPQLSHDLTFLGRSPYWDGPNSRDRWYAFIDAITAAGCATYDDLPPKLKRIYDQAYQLQYGGPPTQG